MTEWCVGWTSEGRRSLSTLPDKAASAAVEFIYGPLSDNPRRVSKPLRLELDGLFSARRGDYRVIFSLDHADRMIVIARIAHRSTAYRPR